MQRIDMALFVAVHTGPIFITRGMAARAGPPGAAVVAWEGVVEIRGLPTTG